MDGGFTPETPGGKLRGEHTKQLEPMDRDEMNGIWRNTNLKGESQIIYQIHLSLIYENPCFGLRLLRQMSFYSLLKPDKVRPRSSFSTFHCLGVLSFFLELDSIAERLPFSPSGFGIQR